MFQILFLRMNKDYQSKVRLFCRTLVGRPLQVAPRDANQSIAMSRPNQSKNLWFSRTKRTWKWFHDNNWVIDTPQFGSTTCDKWKCDWSNLRTKICKTKFTKFRPQNAWKCIWIPTLFSVELSYSYFTIPLKMNEVEVGLTNFMTKMQKCIFQSVVMETFFG